LDDLIFELDGKKYQWNWKFWMDLKSFIEPLLKNILNKPFLII
jgi:hypothetical protein